MSRRPGIGKDVFEKIKDNYEEAKLMVKTNKGVMQLKPGEYYDKLYDNFAPEDLERIKAERKIKGEMHEAIRQTKTSADEFQYRQIQEENLEQRIKILKKRGGVV